MGKRVHKPIHVVALTVDHDRQPGVCVRLFRDGSGFAGEMGPTGNPAWETNQRRCEDCLPEGDYEIILRRRGEPKRKVEPTRIVNLTGALIGHAYPLDYERWVCPRRNAFSALSAAFGLIGEAVRWSRDREDAAYYRGWQRCHEIVRSSTATVRP